MLERCDFMGELILLLLLVFVILPVGAISGTVYLIVRIVRFLIKRNKLEQSENSAESFVYIENKKQVRKFNGSEIMFIIGTIFIILSGIAFGVASWVNTTPSGRVIIMFLASVVMFGVGVLFHKVIKLDGTSTAFCSIGTVLLSVTVIIAGYYELFGSWLSVDGNGGAMLFALSSAITAVASFAEHKFYKNNAFLYVSLMAVSVTIIFLSAQVSKNYDDFAVIMILLQAMLTFYIVRFSKSKPIRITGNISAVVFAVLSFIKVLDSLFEPDGATYLIMITILVQLIYYGIYLNKPILKGLQSVFAVLTTFIFSSDIESTLNENTAIIISSIILVIIYAVNRFLPSLKNNFSEVFTLFFAVYSSIISASLSEECHLIAPVLMSLLIMLYAFAESKFVQVFGGIFSPMMPLIIAENSESDIFDLLVVIFCLITAAIVFLPKYAFSLHAKFPRKTDTILYTNMLTAGMILTISTTDSPENPFLALMVCLLHFAVSSALRNNWTGFFSVIGIIQVVADVTYESDYSLYIMFVVFCCMMIISRIFFKDGIIVKKDNGKKSDVIMFSAWYALMNIESDAKAGDFVCMICIALYIANFIRRKTSQKKASEMLSASAFITAVAFINRPFLIVDSEMVSSKITLAIITLIGIAYRYIWKNNPRISKILSNIIFISSFAGLINDALYFQNLSNTIFVLAVTAVILIISFTTKSKTWFSVSSVALVTITVYATRKYFVTLDWWAYLFIAGVIFIAIASLNEYLKKSGKTIKLKISEMFSGWKW